MPSASALSSTVSVSRNCVSDLPSFDVEIEPIGDTFGLAECVRIPVPPLLADHRGSSDDYRSPPTRRLWSLRPCRPSTTRDSDCGARRLRSVRRSSTHVVIIDCCLLYTSDAADEEDSVDLGGRR